MAEEEREAKLKKTSGETNAEDSDAESDTSEQLPSNVLSQMLAALQGTGDGKGEHKPRFKPFTSNSAPLGAALPAAIKKKIQQFEFVHLETLLPSYKNELSICLTDANSVDGKVSFTTSKNTAIKTFDQWQEAFLIYGSVLLGAHPEEGVGLLKHMSIVRRLYHCRAKWLWYDSEFRRLKAEESFDFSVYHHELVEQAKAYRLSYDFNPSYPSNPSHRPEARRGNEEKPCYAQFNNSGSCFKPRCPYKHVCWTCRGEHPSNRCNRAQQQRAGAFGQDFNYGGNHPGPLALQEGPNARARGGPFKLPPRVSK